MHDEFLVSGDPNNSSLPNDVCPLVPRLQDRAVGENEAAFQTAAAPNVTPGVESISTEMLRSLEIDQAQIDRILQAAPNVQDIYPLSPLQEGMLFHRLLNERKDTYVLSTLFELESHAHVAILISALQQVIDRHDALRTAMLWEQLRRPVQVVYRRATLPVHELALNANRDPIEQLKERMRPGSHRLDLRQAPLVHLLVAPDPRGQQWYALLQLHHLVCDHQSLGAVVAEVMACLECRHGELPPAVPYQRYVVEALADIDMEAAETYFRSRLADVIEPTAPFSLFDVHRDSIQTEEASLALGPELAQEIRLGASRAGVSAARLFHAAWALVVAQTSGKDDVVYGTVLLTGHRSRGQAHRMLGMSVNTLPLRLQLQGLTAKELVERTDRELGQLRKYQHVPLTQAQRCCGITGTAPLFTALLNYRHSESDTQAARGISAGVRVLARGEAWTNYPLTLLVDDLGEEFVLTAQTDRRIDPHRVTAYMQTAVQSLVAALAEAPHTPALTLSVLPSNERYQLLHEFNRSLSKYPHEKLVHQLFEEQVKRTPQSVALVCNGRSLTYAELNGKANQLAGYFRSKGLGPDERVALCVERSLEMVVSLLGVLKAGAAYVPLDPTYPTERLQHMLDDAAPRLLLIQEQLRGILPPTTVEVTAIDSDWNEIAAKSEGDSDLHSIEASSNNLAYVIYTSGSTGKPKGVMVEHRGVVNFLSSMQQSPGITPTDSILAVTTVCFDIAALEIFLPLITGAKLVLATRDVASDPRVLAATLTEAEITILQATPATWQMLLNAGWSGRPAIKALCGGEALTAQLSAELLRRVGSVWNLYGPTETTIWSSCRRVAARSDSGALESIGPPISNTQIYVLDSRLEPVPIGVAGEIYIGGVGVARGYLNRPELTAERFVRDPFSAEPQARMYRTGDLGRWCVDGTIEYLGRNDHQVKVRGFRIELEEIEAQLKRHAQVREAVVTAREDVPGEKRLVAYVVTDASLDDVEDVPTVEGLRAHLNAVLPEYMIPSAVVILDRMPLTPNGKLDRRALPAPELGAYARCSYEAPRGEVEEFLAGVWQRLLRAERIGREDHFFDLGGHSLLAMQAIAQIESAFSIELPVRSLFESPTVKQLAAHVKELRHTRLLDSITEGGAEVDEIVAAVTSMPERKVQELLREFATEGRP